MELSESINKLCEMIYETKNIGDMDALIIASSKVDTCQVMCEGNAFHVLAIISGIIDRVAEKLNCPRDVILRWMMEEG